MSAGRKPGKAALSPTAADSPPPARELTDAERTEVGTFAVRMVNRPQAPRFKAAKTSDGRQAVSPADDIDPALFIARIAHTVGASTEHAANCLLAQAARATAGDDLAEQCNVSTALLAGVAPRDELEGMLAVQTVAAHNLALDMARRAVATDRIDFRATYSNLTAKLLNVCTRQIELIARLRGQTGHQVVRIERVNVEAGGQAVVGNVALKGRGDGDEN